MTEFPRIPDSELDFDSDLVVTLEGVPFSGIAFEAHPEGGVSEVTYRKGRQEGPARDLYPSGAVRAESTAVGDSMMREPSLKSTRSTQRARSLACLAGIAESAPGRREDWLGGTM